MFQKKFSRTYASPHHSHNTVFFSVYRITVNEINSVVYSVVRSNNIILKVAISFHNSQHSSIVHAYMILAAN